MKTSKLATFFIEWEGIKFYKIEGFSETQGVSRCGKVFKFRSGIVSGSDNGSGYLYVGFMRAGVGGRRTVAIGIHRLVAMAFHDNPENKPWVNHKDGDKRNNAADNLEWTTIRENIQHAHDMGLAKPPKGENHYNWGQKLPESTRKLMSLKKVGENHPKFKGWWVTPNGRYSSMSEAEKAEGLDGRKIKKMCLLGQNGFSFEAKKENS